MIAANLKVAKSYTYVNCMTPWYLLTIKLLSINDILYFGLGFGTSKEDTAKRFFLELKVQRTVLAGTELTIRYNSVFEVRGRSITTLTIFWPLLTTTYLPQIILLLKGEFCIPLTFPVPPTNLVLST